MTIHKIEIKTEAKRTTGTTWHPCRHWLALVLILSSGVAKADIDSVTVVNRVNEVSCGNPLILRGAPASSFIVVGDWMDHLKEINTDDPELKAGAIQIFGLNRTVNFGVQATASASLGTKTLDLCYYTLYDEVLDYRECTKTQPPFLISGQACPDNIKRICNQVQVSVQPPSIVRFLTAKRPDTPFRELVVYVIGSRLPNELGIREIALLNNQTIKSDGSSGSSIESHDLIRDNEGRAHINLRFADEMKKVTLRVDFMGGGKNAWNDCWQAFDESSTDSWRKFLSVEVNPYAIRSPSPIKQSPTYNRLAPRIAPR